MTVSETLERVQFVVDADGKPTAAVIDITTWQQIVALLEATEDQNLVRAYLTRRQHAASPATLGLIPSGSRQKRSLTSVSAMMNL